MSNLSHLPQKSSKEALESVIFTSKLWETLNLPHGTPVPARIVGIAYKRVTPKVSDDGTTRKTYECLNLDCQIQTQNPQGGWVSHPFRHEVRVAVEWRPGEWGFEKDFPNVLPVLCHALDVAYDDALPIPSLLEAMLGKAPLLSHPSSHAIISFTQVANDRGYNVYALGAFAKTPAPAQPQPAMAHPSTPSVR